MSDAKYIKATEVEMASFERRLKFWCSHHPLNCYNNCENISMCQNSPVCNSLIANFSQATYTKLSEQIDDEPTAKTIKGYYSNWKANEVKFKKTTPVVKLLNYLSEFEKNPYKSDSRLNNYLSELKNLYKTHQLSKGCILAEHVIKIYPFHNEVVTQWALFHNRTMNWAKVQSILLKKAESLTDKIDVQTVCFLAIFESHLNEFTKHRYETGSFNKLRIAKETFLDTIHEKENNGKYHYFLARYIEEEWWVSTLNTKLTSVPDLKKGIDHINTSINKFKETSNINSNSNYSAGDPWWLYCHRCILLKLINHSTFESNCEEYGKMIKKELEADENILQKSIQIYNVTYYLLRDSREELIDFLTDLEIRVKNINHIKSEDDISEVDNFTYHHVDLIFYDNELKITEYFEILNSWFRNKIK